MNDKRIQNFLITAVIVVAAVGLAIYSWLTLPDMVANQPAGFQTGAPEMPKVFAVALPTVLMVMFGYLGNKERKMFFGSLIGVILHILFWISN